MSKIHTTSYLLFIYFFFTQFNPMMYDADQTSQPDDKCAERTFPIQMSTVFWLYDHVNVMGAYDALF
jgi:hypothetical protein